LKSPNTIFTWYAEFIEYAPYFTLSIIFLITFIMSLSKNIRDNSISPTFWYYMLRLWLPFYLLIWSFYIRKNLSICYS